MTDALPVDSNYVSGGVYGNGAVTLTFPTIPAHNQAAAMWVVSTCQASLINSWYRVVTSTAQVTSDWGPVLATNLMAPALWPTFSQSASVIVVGQVVTVTDQSTTNGSAIAAWAWDWDDGGNASGPIASHTYMHEGNFFVRLTFTDTCGYSGATTATVTVNPPNLSANFDYAPQPANIRVRDTVTFTDVSTTDGPGILGWHWTFGEGGMSLAHHPTHTYNTAGVYTVSLLITDSLGYTATHITPHAITVAPWRVFLPVVLRNPQVLPSLPVTNPPGRKTRPGGFC